MKILTASRVSSDVQQVERNMRSALLMIFLVACGNSGTSGDDTGPDASTSGDSTDGSSNSDAGIDGPPVSYAPCDTCCDPIAQDCGPGAACHPNNGGSVTTCKAEGTDMLGAVCASDTECMAGMTCMADDTGGQYPRCYKLCTVNSECSAYPSMAHQCTLFQAQPGRTPYGLCFP